MASAAATYDLGVAAEPRPTEDPLADACGVDAVSDGLDGSRDFVADNAGRLRRIRVKPNAGKVIGEVDACGVDRDLHLARRGRGWVGPVLDLQNRKVTVLG